MLRSYTYFRSEIQKAQRFVNYIMLDVIFNAKHLTSLTFDSTLVIPKYKAFIDNVNDNYILKPLSEAFLICKGLNQKQIKILKKAVHNNNKIRELCNGDIQPVQYEEISKINAKLSKCIKEFCDYMYDQCLNLAPFYNSYEDISIYYNKLVKKSSSCRCCGIHRVLTEFHAHRSALDHYLPRKHYPFNSINFKNLIPICDICNSKYKLSKDPLFIISGKANKKLKTRTKAFYPYTKGRYNIEISLLLKKPFNSSIKPKDIDIEFSCTGHDEQVASWNRLFGIEQNYKAECCTDEMRLYYEEQYIAIINFGKTHDDYIDMLKNNKYGDQNFIKIPFLQAINDQINSV